LKENPEEVQRNNVCGKIHTEMKVQAARAPRASAATLPASRHGGDAEVSPRQRLYAQTDNDCLLFLSNCSHMNILISNGAGGGGNRP
jgi:hypothetical protein